MKNYKFTKTFPEFAKNIPSNSMGELYNAFMDLMDKYNEVYTTGLELTGADEIFTSFLSNIGGSLWYNKYKEYCKTFSDKSAIVKYRSDEGARAVMRLAIAAIEFKYPPAINDLYELIFENNIGNSLKDIWENALNNNKSGPILASTNSQNILENIFVDAQLNENKDEINKMFARVISSVPRYAREKVINKKILDALQGKIENADKSATDVKHQLYSKATAVLNEKNDTIAIVDKDHLRKLQLWKKGLEDMCALLLNTPVEVRIYFHGIIKSAIDAIKKIYSTTAVIVNGEYLSKVNEIILNDKNSPLSKLSNSTDNQKKWLTELTNANYEYVSKFPNIESILPNIDLVTSELEMRALHGRAFEEKNKEKKQDIPDVISSFDYTDQRTKKKCIYFHQGSWNYLKDLLKLAIVNQYPDAILKLSGYFCKILAQKPVMVNWYASDKKNFDKDFSLSIPELSDIEDKEKKEGKLSDQDKKLKERLTTVQVLLEKIYKTHSGNSEAAFIDLLHSCIPGLLSLAYPVTLLARRKEVLKIIEMIEGTLKNNKNVAKSKNIEDAKNMLQKQWSNINVKQDMLVAGEVNFEQSEELVKLREQMIEALKKYPGSEESKKLILKQIDEMKQYSSNWCEIEKKYNDVLKMNEVMKQYKGNMEYLESICKSQEDVLWLKKYLGSKKVTFANEVIKDVERFKKFLGEYEQKVEQAISDIEKRTDFDNFGVITYLYSLCTKVGEMRKDLESFKATFYEDKKKIEQWTSDLEYFIHESYDEPHAPLVKKYLQPGGISERIDDSNKAYGIDVLLSQMCVKFDDEIHDMFVRVDNKAKQEKMLIPLSLSSGFKVILTQLLDKLEKIPTDSPLIKKASIEKVYYVIAALRAIVALIPSKPTVGDGSKTVESKNDIDDGTFLGNALKRLDEMSVLTPAITQNKEDLQERFKRHILEYSKSVNEISDSILLGLLKPWNDTYAHLKMLPGSPEKFVKYVNHIKKISLFLKNNTLQPISDGGLSKDDIVKSFSSFSDELQNLKEHDLTALIAELFDQFPWLKGEIEKMNKDKKSTLELLSDDRLEFITDDKQLLMYARSVLECCNTIDIANDKDKTDEQKKRWPLAIASMSEKINKCLDIKKIQQKKQDLTDKVKALNVKLESRGVFYQGGEQLPKTSDAIIKYLQDIASKCRSIQQQYGTALDKEKSQLLGECASCFERAIHDYWEKEAMSIRPEVIKLLNKYPFFGDEFDLQNKIVQKAIDEYGYPKPLLRLIHNEINIIEKAEKELAKETGKYYYGFSYNLIKYIAKLPLGNINEMALYGRSAIAKLIEHMGKLIFHGTPMPDAKTLQDMINVLSYLGDAYVGLSQTPKDIARLSDDELKLLSSQYHHPLAIIKILSNMLEKIKTQQLGETQFVDYFKYLNILVSLDSAIILQHFTKNDIGLLESILKSDDDIKETSCIQLVTNLHEAFSNFRASVKDAVKIAEKEPKKTQDDNNKSLIEQLYDIIDKYEELKNKANEDIAEINKINLSNEQKNEKKPKSKEEKKKLEEEQKKLEEKKQKIREQLDLDIADKVKSKYDKIDKSANQKRLDLIYKTYYDKDTLGAIKDDDAVFLLGVLYYEVCGMTYFSSGKNSYTIQVFSSNIEKCASILYKISTGPLHKCFVEMVFGEKEGEDQKNTNLLDKLLSEDKKAKAEIEGRRNELYAAIANTGAILEGIKFFGGRKRKLEEVIKALKVPFVYNFGFGKNIVKRANRLKNSPQLYLEKFYSEVNKIFKQLDEKAKSKSKGKKQQKSEIAQTYVLNAEVSEYLQTLLKLGIEKFLDYIPVLSADKAKEFQQHCTVFVNGLRLLVVLQDKLNKIPKELEEKEVSDADRSGKEYSRLLKDCPEQLSFVIELLKKPLRISPVSSVIGIYKPPKMLPKTPEEMPEKRPTDIEWFAGLLDLLDKAPEAARNNEVLRNIKKTLIREWIKAFMSLCETTWKPTYIEYFQRLKKYALDENAPNVEAILGAFIILGHHFMDTNEKGFSDDAANLFPESKSKEEVEDFIGKCIGVLKKKKNDTDIKANSKNLLYWLDRWGSIGITNAKDMIVNKGTLEVVVEGGYEIATSQPANDAKIFFGNETLPLKEYHLDLGTSEVNEYDEWKKEFDDYLAKGRQFTTSAVEKVSEDFQSKIKKIALYSVVKDVEENVKKKDKKDVDNDYIWVNNKNF
jgi:hypothetical protein